MKIVTLCAAVVTAACTTGCVGPLSEMCAKALPVLSQANSLSTDASIALEAASDAIDKSDLPADQKYKAQVQVENARIALQAASAALTLVDKECREPNISTIFRDFMTAWAAIRPFLALIGGTGGGATVQDPMVWRMSAAQQQ